MTTTPSDYLLRLIGAMIEVNDVVQIIETDPVLDEVSGDWVRDIQFYREPDEGATNPTLILTIRIKGSSKNNIQFHAPEQDY